MPSTRTSELLVGRDLPTAYRWLSVGAVLLAMITGGILVFHTWSPNRLIADRGGHRTAYAMFWGGILILSVVAAAANAYQNGGWAVSVALVGIPSVVLAGHRILNAVLSLPDTPGFDALIPAPPALVVLTLIAGTVAFAAGSGARRLRVERPPRRG